MIRLLHLADLHLGAKPSYLGTRSLERSNDFFRAFEKAVSFAINPTNNINVVVIAGDFFDSSRPSPKCLESTIKQLRKLKAANIPTIVVPGNHDSFSMPGSIYSDKDSPLNELIYFPDSPNPKHFCEFIINGSIVHFYGMIWDPKLSSPPYDQFRTETNEGYHIAVLHSTLINARFQDLHSRDIPLNLDELAKTGMDYIALGHIHSPQEFKAGNIPVVYPGTLEGKRLSPSETGKRYLHIVTLEKGKHHSIEKLVWNNKTIILKKINIEKNAINNQEELIKYIRSEFASEKYILKLELTGVSPFSLNEEEITNKLANDFFFIRIIDNSDLFDSVLIDSWESENTIRGLFVRKLQALMKDAHNKQEEHRIELALKLGVQSFQKYKGD